MPTQADSPPTSPPTAAPALPAFDIDKPRIPGDIGFGFTVRGSSRRYRVEPTRWPEQPRFWGFRVFRCGTGHGPDPTERPWIGAGGMTRAELPDAALAIRADLDAWLAREEHDALRRWILEI